MDKIKEVNKTIKRINGLIKKDKDVVVVEDFGKKGNHFSGKIKVKYLKKTLFFDIHIPHHYPLTHPNSDNISIIFRNEKFIGLNHINPDGSVCFHPDKDDDFDRKFSYELKCLKQWIRDYYILKKEDPNYAYLIHSTESESFNQLYFTNTNNNFEKGDFGNFNYSVFSNEIIGDKKFSFRKLFRIGFEENESDSWSKTFISTLKSSSCKKGVYYFIGEEPLKKLVKGRKSIELWKELEDYLSLEFIKSLSKGLKGEYGKSFFYDKNLFLILGYKIPNEESYEEHWDLIRIPKGNIPILTKRIPKSERKESNEIIRFCLKDTEIKWGSTENIDYSRFFGRGKLDNKITNSRIFLIGCGALGSSLAEILVRGGVKNMVVDDFDTIRGGNLCRANYELTNLVHLKTSSLAKRLKSISPFVNLGLESKKLNNYDLELIEKYFNENIDIIFDCSTDPEVTYILDKIDFKGQVFSLGITNNAKSFVSVTGSNLSRQSKVLYDYVENEPPSYFEGAGCGYPTFEANYNDINTLLNTGLKVINNNFSKNKSNHTLIVKPNFENEPVINIVEYEYYNCSYNNSSIHISKSVLRKIKEITNIHYPKEFGGVFIGFRDNENFIITNILIPDAYENGRTIFVREPGTLNERLKEIHKITDGKIQYLGEWHSHPDGPTSPSNTDNKAMEYIAEDKNIKVDKPLLMIVEVGQIPFDKDLYVYDNKRLRKYE